MNYNKVFLVGRITKDPEFKKLPTGTAVVKFSLATNHVYKNKAGEKVETAQFHNCVAFARIAEIVDQYVKKGQEVMIDGRIEYRSWEKKEGGKGYITEIMVEGLQMGQQAKGQEQGKKIVETAKVESDDIPIIEENEIRVEDIPF